MTKYSGFHFPMGSFIIWNDKQVLMGRCDPVTKEILGIHTPPDKEGYITHFDPRLYTGIKKDLDKNSIV